MIHQLKTDLFSGKTTSVDLVKAAIALNQKYLDKRALALISPNALALAATRDEERKQGKIKGPLHGIPIVIKDNICYADGTPTTANSFALANFFPKTNAPLVDSLINAGAIILGKANLSEFAYFMGDEKMPSGYGSMYGQVKHPVDESIDPYGSSTGSAVAVALGIVPIAIGTETNGSLMAPAYQTQIVSFKPTVGMISRRGIIPISPTQDTAGPMTTSVEDCAILMDVISDIDPQDALTQSVVRPSSFTEKIYPLLKPQRIGIVYFDNQPYDAIDQSILDANKAALLSQGHDVKAFHLNHPALDNYPTLLREFKVSLNTFLASHQQEGCPASLAEIIAFNEKHADRCLKYGQATLIASQATPNEYNQDFHQMRQQLLEEAEMIQNLLEKENLDVIITPTWTGFAPIYGNPCLCLPKGYVEGKP
ncbi:MAG: amidase family protein, partial [Bacilli bacterium]